MSSEIDNLIDQYGENIVRRAFALQQHIKDNGIEGVYFIETARQKTKARKYYVTLKQLKSNVPRRP